MHDEPRSLDILGIKPIGESVKAVTEGAIEGAAAFLSRICLPAAEEFGLLLRDRVRFWRAVNLAKITQKAERLLFQADAPADIEAHPRIVSKILEEGSWVEDDLVQEMWAGLLASSCSGTELDDSNLIFVSLLGELTKVQTRILNHACANAPKSCMRNGLVVAQAYTMDLEQLRTVSKECDMYRLDRELDHLRGLELIHGGFDPDGFQDVADVIPSALALQLYVRAQGSRQSPVEFFELERPNIASPAPSSGGDGASVVISPDSATK